MNNNQPSIGQIVHYVSYGTPGGEYKKACRAAIITQVYEPDDGFVAAVSLAVLNPTGMFFNEVCRYDGYFEDEVQRGGTWHWPEQV